MTNRVDDVIYFVIIALSLIVVAAVSAFFGFTTGLVVSSLGTLAPSTLNFGEAWSDFGLSVAVLSGIVCFLFFGVWSFMASVSKMAYTVSHD